MQWMQENSDETEDRTRQPNLTNSYGTADPSKWLIVGVLMTLVGLVIMFASSGSEDSIAPLGFIVAGIGGVVLQVWVIAKGVEIGIRSSWLYKS